MVNIRCSHCHNQMAMKLSQALSYDKHYCSYKCQGDANRKGTYTQCAACSKLIYKSQSDKAKSKTGNVFCNSSCSSTFNNKNVKRN